MYFLSKAICSHYNTNYETWIKSEIYRETWVNESFNVYNQLLDMFPDLNIYVENMFDSDPILLEKLAFNALPSACTNDMWGHQYDNQVNAPFIKRSEVFPWTTNGPESNIYGLEPHFGCCTSNLHQGWPKFVQSLVYFDSKGLVFNSYSPVKIKNRKYDLEIKSGYPFDYEIDIEINLNKASLIRFLVPSFVTSFSISVDTEIKGDYAVAKLEKGNHKIHITMTSAHEFVKRSTGYSLIDGPLVYALKVEQEKVRINV